MFCLFVCFGLRILVLMQPHGIKLLVFSLKAWSSIDPNGCFCQSKGHCGLCSLGVMLSPGYMGEKQR